MYTDMLPLTFFTWPTNPYPDMKWVLINLLYFFMTYIQENLWSGVNGLFCDAKSVFYINKCIDNIYFIFYIYISISLWIFIGISFIIIHNMMCISIYAWKLYKLFCTNVNVLFRFKPNRIELYFDSVLYSWSTCLYLMTIFFNIDSV